MNPAVITPPEETLETISATPERGDGSLYAYELIYAGDRRVYADTETALLEVLIEGYAQMSEDERWESRLLYAIRAQVIAQAELNADTDAFQSLTHSEQVILQGPRHAPPVVPTWSARVPLVLVSTYYEPAGPNPQPVRDRGMEPNVIWVNPSDDHSLLVSLHDIGVITLNTSR